MHSSFLGVQLPAIIILSLISSCLSFNPAFPYGSQKVRGVNLGGWLVLGRLGLTDVPLLPISSRVVPL